MQRDITVDALRGIAILLVVLWHTMTGCSAGAYESFVFDIVWSLQIPLFVLISGYVTKFSRQIDDIAGLKNYLFRRTFAYLLPWAVWTFLIHGIIFGRHEFLNLKWVFWHMDSGYWFLVTIWTINVIFGLASFAARSALKKRGVGRQAVLCFLYVFGMLALFGIGKFFGFSFFAVKLTLYYMPFYYFGYLCGCFSGSLLKQRWFKKLFEAAIAVSLAVWFFIMSRYSLYNLPDTFKPALLRVCCSIAGCFAVCGLGTSLCSGTPNIAVRFLALCGRISLEIYLVHGFVLNLLVLIPHPEASSIQGVALIFSNYFLTITLTLFIIISLSSNRFVKRFLFGKLK